MRPKISIVIPVYNAELFLRECLDSIYKQILKDFEIICVNDGSTDDSLSILQEYKLKYTNITVINQKNSGIGSATNKAIKQAKGEYLYSLDNDDYLVDENVLNFLYENVKKYDLDILTFNYKTEKHIKKIKQKSYVVKSGKEYLCGEHIPPLWSRICKLEYLKSINFKFLENISFVDTEATPRLIIGAQRVMHIDKVLYHWRRLGNEKVSISQNLNNIKSAYAYMETTKTYDSLFNKENNKELKNILKKERFKAIIEFTRIIAVVNTKESEKLLYNLMCLDFDIFEKIMIKNEKSFFYNSYILNKKKIYYPYVYLLRKITKQFI